MNYKNAILGAASVLAILAGSSAANASVTPDSTAAATQTATAGHQSDPLFAVIALTKQGDDAGTAVSNVFEHASAEQIGNFPLVLAGLNAMGLSKHDLDESKVALMEIVNNSSAIDDQTRADVTAALNAEVKQIQLAQNDQGNLEKRLHRDPETTGSVRCFNAGL